MLTLKVAGALIEAHTRAGLTQAECCRLRIEKAEGPALWEWLKKNGFTVVQQHLQSHRMAKREDLG